MLRVTEGNEGVVDERLWQVCVAHELQHAGFPVALGVLGLVGGRFGEGSGSSVPVGSAQRVGDRRVVVDAQRQGLREGALELVGACGRGQVQQGPRDGGDGDGLGGGGGTGIEETGPMQADAGPRGAAARRTHIDAHLVACEQPPVRCCAAMAQERAFATCQHRGQISPLAPERGVPERIDTAMKRPQAPGGGPPLRPLSPSTQPTPGASQPARGGGQRERNNSAQALTQRSRRPSAPGHYTRSSVTAGPSLYRRHRPRTFADVVGQEHVVRTLRNAVEQGKVHHAYLFVGSRGTGKTSMAKMLAACMNCEHGPTVEPCGRCESCIAIANATSLDVIEMDAASNNSVDDIRELRESVQFAPVSGRSKVYILDEAHMLSSQAWNAFLKTLEEPPPHTIFVLATTEAQKVLPTVVDRCHRFDFARPTVEQIATVVTRVAAAESIEIAPDAVALLARHATGSFRDALGTLEQLVTYTGTTIATGDVLAVLGVADADLLFEAFDAVAAGDARAAWLAAAKLADTGRDIAQFLKDLEGHARDLLVVQTLGEVPYELRLTPDRDERLLEQARRVPGPSLIRLLDLLAEALRTVKDGADARTRLETALVKAAAPQMDPAARALSARIERLEAALAAGAATPASGAAAPAAERPAPAAERPAPAAAQPGPAAPPPSLPEPTTPQQPARADQPTPRAEQPTPAPTPTPDHPSAAEPDPNGTHPVALAEAEEPTLDAVRSLWPAVLEALRADKGALAASLSEAQPVEVRGNQMIVAFAEDDTFNRRMADSPAHRAAVEEALRDLGGRQLRVSYELRDLGDAGHEPPPSEDEIVNRFKHAFDAEEIVPEDEPEPDKQEGQA